MIALFYTDQLAVASLLISRWCIAIKDKARDVLRNRLDIAITMRTSKACRGLLERITAKTEALTEAGQT